MDSLLVGSFGVSSDDSLRVTQSRPVVQDAGCPRRRLSKTLTPKTNCGIRCSRHSSTASHAVHKLGFGGKDVASKKNRLVVEGFSTVGKFSEWQPAEKLRGNFDADIPQRDHRGSSLLVGLHWTLGADRIHSADHWGCERCERARCSRRRGTSDPNWDRPG
jgi:hypothetical protein